MWQRSRTKNFILSLISNVSVTLSFTYNNDVRITSKHQTWPKDQKIKHNVRQKRLKQGCTKRTNYYFFDNSNKSLTRCGSRISIYTNFFWHCRSHPLPTFFFINTLAYKTKLAPFQIPVHISLILSRRAIRWSLRSVCRIKHI